MFTETTFHLNGGYTDIRHNSETFHEVMKGFNLLDTSHMFRASYVLALLKLHYLLKGAMEDGNLQYDRASRKFTLSQDIFIIQDRDDVEAICSAYDMPYLQGILSDQVIRDGLDTLYSTVANLEIESNGITVTVKGREAYLYADALGNPYQDYAKCLAYASDYIMQAAQGIYQFMAWEIEDEMALA